MDLGFVMKTKQAWVYLFYVFCAFFVGFACETQKDNNDKVSQQNVESQKSNVKQVSRKHPSRQPNHPKHQGPRSDNDLQAEIKELAEIQELLNKPKQLQKKCDATKYEKVNDLTGILD